MSNARCIYCQCCQNACCKQRGYYREYIAPELLAFVLNEVVEHVKLDANLIDDVITVWVYQIGGQPLELSTDVGISYQFAASRTKDHAEAVKVISGKKETEIYRRLVPAH